MNLLPFSLSYLILTPRRVRLPGEAPPAPTATLNGSAPRWSSRFLFKARSLRSGGRPQFPTAPGPLRSRTTMMAGGLPANNNNEMAYVPVGSTRSDNPTSADETTILLNQDQDYDHETMNSDPTLINTPTTSPRTTAFII